MTRRPWLLLLNATCLDLVDEYRQSIASRGVELIADQRFRSISPQEIVELLKEADAAIIPAVHRTLPLAEHMPQCPDLLTLSIAASGFDMCDVDACTRHGIVVTYAPGGDGAEVVADYTWGMMLALARQIPYHHRRLELGDGTRGMGRAIYGKTLGIVGLGHIGRAVARRARGFDMTVLAADPAADADYARNQQIELMPLHELLRRADVVSLHVRLSPDTQEMIDRRAIDLMKSSAFLVNTARIELMNEQHIAEALESGRIAGAAIDDPPGPALRPLMTGKNVIFTPHLGNRALEGMRRVFEIAIDNAIDVMQGRRPAMLVNPQVYDSPALRRPKP